MNQVVSGWTVNSYYESEWGIGITFFSLLFSTLAPLSEWLQTLAVVSSELAMGFNIVITPIFWLILAPMIFPHIDYSTSEGKYTAFEMCFVHGVPICVTTFELLVTDMVFLHRDSWICAGAGVAYTFFNLAGVINLPGHMIYPILDWKHPFLTFIGYLLQAPVLYGINMCIATKTQKNRHFIEKGYQVIHDAEGHHISHSVKQDLNSSATQE